MVTDVAVVYMFGIIVRNGHNDRSPQKGGIVPPAHYFRCQNSTDHRAQLSQRMREAEFALYRGYAASSAVEDFDLEVEELAQVTSRPKHEVEAAVLAYFRLASLPKLLALQEQTCLLSVHMLTGIDTALCKIGASADEATWAAFDDMLTRIFTPKRANQELPSRASVARRIRTMIAKLDVGLSHNPEKRKKREAEHNHRARNVEFSAQEDHGSAGIATMTLSTDATTMAVLRASLQATARQEKVSLADAAVKLLNGDVEPAANVRIHVYAPAGADGTRAAGAPVFIPRYGWTDALATAELESLLSNHPPETANLDETATTKTDSYAPTEGMKHYAHARDGNCIFPGCDRPATACQLDHRIPFDRGGETTPHNLFCLCPHHHNMKTDKRIFYVPDPVTGDIVWLCEDGTYLLSRHEGPLFDETTPTTTRWRSTLPNVARNRDAYADFLARAHHLLDEYDNHGDYYRLMADLQALEHATGHSFDLAPEPPTEDSTVIPEEPDPDPYPEPEREPCPFPPGYVPAQQPTQRAKNAHPLLTKGCASENAVVARR